MLRPAVILVVGLFAPPSPVRGAKRIRILFAHGRRAAAPLEIAFFARPLAVLAHRIGACFARLWALAANFYLLNFFARPRAKVTNLKSARITFRGGAFAVVTELSTLACPHPALANRV